MAQSGKSFVCHKCGACCRLVRHLPTLAHLDRGDGTCRHLESVAPGEYRCGVYETRPAECRIGGQCPPHVPPERWYRDNADACRVLHLRVYFEPAPWE